MNRLAWGVVLMLGGVALMVGEFWLQGYSIAALGITRPIPTVHRVLEWIIIAYGAYLASPPLNR
jgi:hypothetical protein